MAARLTSWEAGCLVKICVRSGWCGISRRRLLLALCAGPQRSFMTSKRRTDQPKALPSGRLRVAPAVDLPPEEPERREKFVPITRHSLIRHLMQEDNFLTENESKNLPQFSVALDSAIVNRYQPMLQDLKSLFDPLNPDKDTQTTQKWTRRERLDNEFWLLQRLGGIMEKANFYELPKAVIQQATAEHTTPLGLRVSVDTDKYDVMHFWALGREVGTEKPSIIQRLIRLLQRADPPKPIEFYKRVVVAMRLKKDDKLLLKAFKEVPVESLDLLLPDGRVRMSQLDQRLLAGTLGITAVAMVTKVLMMQLNIAAPYLVLLAALSSAVAVRVWTASKNKRQLHLVEISRMLYFKNIANNRGLLGLLVDRAEDETFKEAILAYTFLLTKRPPSAETQGSSDNLPVELGGMSAGQLETAVEDWILEKTGVRVEFESDEAVKLLTDFGLLSEDQTTGTLQVLPLQAAMRNLPRQPQTISARTDEYDLVEGYDRDITDETEEEYKREAKKRKRFGWF